MAGRAPSAARPAELEPLIGLRSLDMRPCDAAAYSSDAGTIALLRRWDRLSSVLALGVNAVVLFRLHKDVDVAWAPCVSAFVVAVSTLQFLLIACAHRPAYHRHRTAVCALVRAIRFISIARFLPWIRLKSGPAATYSGTSFAAPLLFEALLSLLQNTYHLLPLRVHLVTAAIRLALEVAFVGPALGCLLASGERWSRLVQSCSRACALLGASAATCACGDTSWAWYLALLALFMGSGKPSQLTGLLCMQPACDCTAAETGSPVGISSHNPTQPACWHAACASSTQCCALCPAPD
jgi:hypothetical protein